MPRYLRFTPEEYQALRSAGATVKLSGPLSGFRRALAAALQTVQPALAGRIARMQLSQVGTLRGHLEGELLADNEVEPRAVRELSYEEWRTISRACGLALLRTGDVTSFHQQLLCELEYHEPELARKVALLDAVQIAALYRGVKNGRRWCP